MITNEINSEAQLDIFETVASDDEADMGVDVDSSKTATEEKISDGKEFYCPCVELDNEFIMNEEDLFVDDDSPLSVFVAAYKGYLPGMEYIIEDRTAGDIKCTLCRAFLKTNNVVLEHMKTHRHQLKYLTKLEPGYVKSLQKKNLKNFEISQAVHSRCCDILRRLGRQKPRVHEKNHEEKKRQKILNLVAKQISKNSETKRNSNGLQVDELDEMPKSAMITKTLLMAKIETFPEDEVSYVDAVMKELPGPVVGLEYVAEYTDGNNVYEPGYFCFLCESVMNSSQLVTHVVKTDHKLKYLQRDHQNYYNILVFPGFSKERKDALIDKYCLEIEENSGRSAIKSRAILPPDGEFVFKHHRKLGDNIEEDTCLIDASVKVMPPAAAALLNGDDEGAEKTTGILYLQKQRQKQIEAKEKIANAAMIKPVRCLVPKPPPGFVNPATVGQQTIVNTSLPPPVNTSLPPPVNTSLPPPVNTSLPPPVNTSLPPPAVVIPVAHGTVAPNLHLQTLAHSTFGYQPPVTNIIPPIGIHTPHIGNLPHPPLGSSSSNYSGPVFESTSVLPPTPVYNNAITVNARPPFNNFYPTSNESSVPFYKDSSNPAPSIPGVQARKPDFIYSERALKERRFAELEKHLPEFSDRNLDSEWFSLRALSWDFCRKRNHDRDFVSVRSKLPAVGQYGDWSPYLMRRLQDQFNFGLDHLAWLQEQFLRWRTPLYIPLEMFDLRPLEEDVETAVLEILVGKVLKPSSKSRKVYDYSTPYVSTFVKKPRFDVFEYNHQENGERIAESVPIADDDRKSVDSNSRQVLEKNPTPVPYQQDLLQLSDKILEASREKAAETKNPVLNELLNYGEAARYILYNITMKDKNNLTKLIEIIKNPNREIDAAFFNEMKEKFREYAKL